MTVDIVTNRQIKLCLSKRTPFVAEFTMAIRANKKRNTDKRGAAVFVFVVAGFVLLFCAMLIFNANYARVYDMPTVKGGVLDFSGYSTRDERSIAFNLAGEWEFFYNRFIVTDGDDGEPDGLISVPGRWTGERFGGDMLPAGGYASYRLTVKNMEKGDPVWVYRSSYAGAYRVFVNGVLDCECGVVSKDARETKSGYPERRTIVEADGGDTVIVIELSANNTGGLNAAPWLNHGKYISAGWNAVYDMRTAMFGMAIATTLIILFMTIGFYRYEKTWAFAVLSAVLTLHFAVSKDVARVLGMGYGVAGALGLASGVAVLAAFAALFAQAGGGMSKKLAAAVLPIECACLATYIPLRATDFAFVPLFVGIMCSFAMLYPLLSSRTIKPSFKALYACGFTATAGVLIAEAADGTGVLVFGTESIFSFVLLAIILVAAVALCLKIAATAKRIKRVGELERELFSLKQDALRAKIKPHFVFNSLTAIQALYRVGTEAGEAQLLRFAEYLRTSIDAENSALIPFATELEHVTNYFELENLRRGGTLNFLLDIRADDFDVPVLSLQPFVENAVKHARTDEKEIGRASCRERV